MISLPFLFNVFLFVDLLVRRAPFHVRRKGYFLLNEILDFVETSPSLRDSAQTTSEQFAQEFLLTFEIDKQDLSNSSLKLLNFTHERL